VVYFYICSREKRNKEEMSVALLELNEAKSAIKSGTVIEVSKKAFEGAMERGLENAGLMEALEIDVREGCDGCDGAGDGGGKFKVVVFFDSRHGGARGEIESKMKESKMKESDESEGPTDTKVPEESKVPKELKARVVEEALRGVKGPRLVRFHLAVAGARKAVWVPIDSKLENALRWMVVEEMKDTEVPKESETDGPMAPMAPNEPEVPKETGGAMEPKTEEKKALKAEETKVPMETEPNERTNESADGNGADGADGNGADGNESADGDEEEEGREGGIAACEGSGSGGSCA
jgi:hypothetical protein